MSQLKFVLHNLIVIGYFFVADTFCFDFERENPHSQCLKALWALWCWLKIVTTGMIRCKLDIEPNATSKSGQHFISVIVYISLYEIKVTENY